MTADVQRENVRTAAPALAAIAAEHELVLSHGNGPQVGLLALQAAAYTDVEPYPLDVLGAQTEGMIGYVLEQELGNYFPPSEPFATILTMVEVDPDDPAFEHPTKFVGPVYPRNRRSSSPRRRAGRSARTASRGAGWCRPRCRSTSSRSSRSAALLDLDVVVICAGGGGIPTMVTEVAGKPSLTGVEAVIDKDLASELLAREVDADLFVMATDVDAVYADWGTPQQRALGRVTVGELRQQDFPAGSMGPKVEAACRFVEATGGRAAIGALDADPADRRRRRGHPGGGRVSRRPCGTEER